MENNGDRPPNMKEPELLLFVYFWRRWVFVRGMWDLPRLGLEPVSPALAGGFLTTAPPGKSRSLN